MENIFCITWAGRCGSAGFLRHCTTDSEDKIGVETPPEKENTCMLYTDHHPLCHRVKTFLFLGIFGNGETQEVKGADREGAEVFIHS